MELLGVIFATVFLALAFVYYSVFPLMLNFALSFGAAVLLARNRGFLVWLTLFLVTSLLLTFATRLPDFIYDAVNLPETERSIIQPLQLFPGDTVNLAEQYLPIEHRSSYFGTPGYEGAEMRVGIAGQNFYKEDIVYLLEGMGLRLNFGQPLPGAPVIALNRTETKTHQQLELTISKDARQLASYRTSDRMHFTDELGGGDFRLHLGHITKNSLWNWLLRFNETRESQPLSNLIKAAIHVSTESVPVPTFEVRPKTRAAALTTFDEGIYSEARGKFFDCTHPDQPYVSGSALRTRVVHERYRLEMTWPTAGLPLDSVAYGSGLRVVRIACGADGFAAWISGKSAIQRIVIADTYWRAMAVFDFQVPEIPADSRVHIMNFRQSEDTVLMEIYIESNRTSDQLLTPVILVKITHPLLASDYGGAARSWPSIPLD